MNSKWVMVLLAGLLFSSGLFASTRSLEDVAKRQGFFFFFQSSCPHCQHFAPSLKRFSEQHGFSVVAISADGGYLHSFPKAIMDEGQLRTFGVTVFPALFLVNPKNQSAALVTESNIDEKVLAERVLKIIQMQEEGTPP